MLWDALLMFRLIVLAASVTPTTRIDRRQKPLALDTDILAGAVQLM
ncbi:hypothetical protein [Ensifer adhaerens]|nr:hypothetical protein [Ensifer adhaerens]